MNERRDTEARPSRPPQDRLTLARRILWHFVYVICLLYSRLFYRFRVQRPGRLPTGRPILILANHQSYLDPLFLGVALHPTIAFSMARRSLWNHRLLGWLITSLNAIAVERGEMDMHAIRRCLAILGQGNALVLYPEGTRTLDGSVGPFASGIMLLIRRARPLVVPAAIDGAFDVWPKGRSRPRLTGTVRVCLGTPVEAQTLLDMGGDAATAFLHARVCALKDQADHWRNTGAMPAAADGGETSDPGLSPPPPPRPSE